MARVFPGRSPAEVVVMTASHPDAYDAPLSALQASTVMVCSRAARGPACGRDRARRTGPQREHHLGAGGPGVSTGAGPVSAYRGLRRRRRR